MADNEARAAEYAKYNERFKLGPLDRPGTEEYFAALLRSEARRAEKFAPARAAAPARRLPAVRVVKSTGPTAQNCDDCGVFLPAGEAALAHVTLPVVFCATHGEDLARKVRPIRNEKGRIVRQNPLEPVTIC